MGVIEYIRQYEKQKINAAEMCKQLYEEFTAEEVNKMPKAVQDVWIVGFHLSEPAQSETKKVLPSKTCTMSCGKSATDNRSWEESRRRTIWKPECVRLK